MGSSLYKVESHKSFDDLSLRTLAQQHIAVLSAPPQSFYRAGPVEQVPDS
jgi:hypothetical protein